MRNPLTSLSKAQKLWGTNNTTFVRPQYVKAGFCQWCGKEITGKRKSVKVNCSEECRNKYNRAVYANYGGGARCGYGNHILRRDNYTCQKCGEFYGLINEHGIKIPTDRGLHIHHIKQIQYGGDDAPDNLISLCSSCHKDIHKTEAKP